MAYRSSGRTNAELVRNMHNSRLIQSDKVLRAFLAVDRGHFVHPSKRDAAYLDEPSHHGTFHLSAPHMYATVLEALDLEEGLSFLNIGSGSGYLSFLVAKITGCASINHGIEQHKELVEHAASRCAKIEAYRDMNSIRFRAGDAFSLNTNSGQKYDRIYVGGGIKDSAATIFQNLLNVGGLMVAPREDELVCIHRISGDRFDSRAVTSVRFHPLTEPSTKTARLVGGSVDLSESERIVVSYAAFLRNLRCQNDQFMTRKRTFSSDHLMKSPYSRMVGSFSNYCRWRDILAFLYVHLVIVYRTRFLRLETGL